MKRFFCALLLLSLSSCFQAYNDGEDDLNTTPITNNPNIVPNHSSGFPGMAKPIR